MKKYLTPLIVLIIFFGYFVFSAWSDYTWEERYLKAVGSDALVFSKQNNSVDLIHFYTLFKIPVTRIGYISKKSIVNKGDGIYFIKEVWSDKEIGEGVTRDVFQYFIDCNKQREGWLRNSKGSVNVPSSTIDINKLTWTGFDEGERIYKGANVTLNKECELLLNDY